MPPEFGWVEEGKKNGIKSGVLLEAGELEIYSLEEGCPMGVHLKTMFDMFWLVLSWKQA